MCIRDSLDEEQIVMKKRPKTGLLAGLYEFPNVEGKQQKPQVLSYMKKLGIEVIHIQKLPEVKHIFSHIEWHMQGYLIQVDELSNPMKLPEESMLVNQEDFIKKIPLPTAFSYYNEYIWKEYKLHKQG
jgi:A/G-specific adenine glycosylase